MPHQMNHSKALAYITIMEELTIRKQSRELYALAGGSWDSKQFLMLCNWLSASKVRVSANIIQD